MPYCANCGASFAGTGRRCAKCGGQTEVPVAEQKTAAPPSSPPPKTVATPAACRYHPQSAVVGRCVDCHTSFCADCAVEIIRHGSVCLDCGARFAGKKLRQAYWAAGIGLAFGLVISFMAISDRQWAMALWPPFVYAYLFPAVFFGWHYGGKIWKRLGALVDRFHGMAGMFAAVFFLAIRVTVAIYAGVFGGGIVQFLRYRKLLALQESLATGQPAPRTGTRTLVWVGSIVAIAVVAVIALSLSVLQQRPRIGGPAGPSPTPVGAERRGVAVARGGATSGASTALLSMVRQGNLVTPRGASAYDAFLRMKQQNLSGNDLSLLQAQVLPVLGDWSDKAFQRWHDESNLTAEDWRNLQRACAWVTELDPSRTDFQARLAYANAQLEFLRGDYPSASRYFNEAARLAPKWALPANALGRIAIATGKPSDAEALYKQAVELEPDWMYPNLNLAGYYMRSKRYDLALPYAERAAKLAPAKPTPHYRLAQVYRNLGRTSEARAQLQYALEALQQSPSSDLNAGQIRADMAALEASPPQ